MTPDELTTWYAAAIDPIVLVEGEDRRREVFRRIWHFLQEGRVSDERVRAWVRQTARRALSKADISPVGLYTRLIKETAPSRGGLRYSTHTRAPRYSYPAGTPSLTDLLARYRRGEDIHAYVHSHHPCTLQETTCSPESTSPSPTPTTTPPPPSPGAA